MQQTQRFDPWPGTDWPRPRAWIPAWLWQALLAASLVAGLLLALHQVVQGAVHDGEKRRVADAARAMELSRCNTMGDVRSAANCLRQLGVTARSGARASGAHQLAALDD